MGDGDGGNMAGDEIHPRRRSVRDINGDRGQQGVVHGGKGRPGRKRQSMRRRGNGGRGWGERERARRNQYFALSPEEENSLEEFAWAFGSDAVREIEKQVKWIVEQIHGISDLEQLSEAGLEEKLEFWHSLGPLDEDELLRRMELHIDDLPDELKENSALAVRLIERRRRVLRDRILREYPNIREHLQEKREVLEQRLQKQNPEGIRKLHELENQQEIRNSY